MSHVVGIGNMTHMCKTHTKQLNLNYVRLIAMIAVTVWMTSVHNIYTRWSSLPTRIPMSSLDIPYYVQRWSTNFWIVFILYKYYFLMFPYNM